MSNLFHIIKIEKVAFFMSTENVGNTHVDTIVF